MATQGSQAPRQGVKSFPILGVRVDAVQIPDVVRILSDWIDRRTACRFVAVTGMHGVSEARKDPDFRQTLNSAGLIVADGMPLVWLGRCRGWSMARRVYGPEMMWEFLRATAPRGYRHFLYGGAPGVANALAERLKQSFPGISIVGTHCPPFRPLTNDETESITAIIQRAAPDVVWVGLSTPKQEKWMHQFQQRLSAPVLVGVGAAFDVHSGRSRQAPAWMQENGLEWFFRLLHEPRRLWRRYLLNGPPFVFFALRELWRDRRRLRNLSPSSNPHV